jgi:hypothetical protein
MQVIVFLHIGLIALSQSFVHDSTIFAVDANNWVLLEQHVKGQIIDHEEDEHIYVLTKRYLYKLDRQSLSVIDRTPLPLRFNHLITHVRNIVLVASNEVIVLDKTNLTFKTGIGIEYGDYQPVFMTESSSMTEHATYICLLIHADQKSILKLYDLESGKLIRKKTLDRVVSCDFCLKRNVLTVLDINNTLTVYDIDLNIIQTMKLTHGGNSLYSINNGYVIFSSQGIFFINREGQTIDFQPAPLRTHGIDAGYARMVNNGIVYVDPLTLRCSAYCVTSSTIVGLFVVNTGQGTHGIAQDRNSNTYVIDDKTSTLRLLKKTAYPLELQPISSTQTHGDSLWYYQLGAFSDYDNAFAMYTYYRSSNIPVFIDSSNLYRIKLGGFRSKSEGLECVETAEFNGWFVFHTRVKQDDAEFYINAGRYVLNNDIILKE